RTVGPAAVDAREFRGRLVGGPASCSLIAALTRRFLTLAPLGSVRGVASVVVVVVSVMVVMSPLRSVEWLVSWSARNPAGWRGRWCVDETEAVRWLPGPGPG